MFNGVEMSVHKNHFFNIFCNIIPFIQIIKQINGIRAFEMPLSWFLPLNFTEVK